MRKLYSSLTRPHVVRILVCLLLMAMTPSAWSAIDFVGFTETGSSKKASSLTLFKPAGLLTGDVMIATIAQDKNGNWKPPAGWTVVQASDGSQDPRLVVWMRVASASEPISYNFNSDKSEEVVGGIAAYRGVDAGAPIAASAIQANAAAAGVAASIAPSISPAVENAMLIGVWGTENVSISAPAGMTENIGLAAGKGKGAINILSAYEGRSASGVTGNRLATLSNTNKRSNAVMIALKPAPTFSIANASVIEGNSGASIMTFTVTQSAVSGLSTSVNYATSDLTASGGASCAGTTDYVTSSGTLSIVAGVTTGAIAITICGDSSYEGDESFKVTLSSPVNATLGAATATGTLLNDDAPPLVAAYHFDETTWNGTAGEVKDSSGNGHNAVAALAITGTGAPGPAYSSAGQSTCGFGVFDGGSISKSYVQLPNSLPGLSGSFSLTAWINSSNASAQHQRIFVRDDEDNGWALSLADGTDTGVLRFFNRNVSFNSPSGGVVSAGGVAIDTTFRLSSNTWYFIALTVDTVGKTVVMYAYDTSGVQRSKMSASFTGTWGAGTGATAIGGETSSSSEGRQPGWHFLGRIDEVRIYTGALTQTLVEALLPTTRLCGGVPPATPANFNCIESGANASTGHLYTKLAGTGFSFDVVALKADGSTETTYATAADKNVTVELVDGSGAIACQSRTVISPAVNQTLTFTKANQPTELGRKAAASMTVSKAYADLRCRVTDANQSPSIVGCSTDDFAVRPNGLTVTSSANALGSSPGATPAIKAGVSFTLTANSSTVGYDGVPKLDASKVAAHAGALQIGTLVGSFASAAPVTGTAQGTFTYSEVGYFNFATNGVYDDTFTAVDSAASDCTADFSNTAVSGKVGCNFGNAAATSYFGRFMPDHFAVSAPAFTPGCSLGGFSYMDQPFALSAVIEARNSGGIRTRNYTGTFANGVVSIQMENANSGTSIPSTRLGGLGVPVWVTGSYPVVATQFLKLIGGPDGSYESLDIGLGIADETALAASARPYLIFRDMDASTPSCTVDMTGLSTAASVCTATKIVSATKMRYGRLQMRNAHGSELLALPIPLVAAYWNGSAFVRNASDNCTPLSAPTSGSGLTLHLASSGSTTATLNSPLVAGDAGFRLSAPGASHTGYVDISVAAPSYLKFNWKGLGEVDPTARATFGVYKSPLIYRRENY